MDLILGIKKMPTKTSQGADGVSELMRSYKETPATDT